MCIVNTEISHPSLNIQQDAKETRKFISSMWDSLLYKEIMEIFFDFFRKMIPCGKYNSKVFSTPKN